MRLSTPEIAWHGKEPIFSVDFCKTGPTWRLASAGADNDVKIWSVKYNEKGDASVEFLANLTRHTKSVNVVRFSPKEELLASGGDDCMVLLWKLTPQDQRQSSMFGESGELENKESWTVTKMLRGHIEDVYDLAWSPEGTFLVSGSVDNSAIIWDINKGQKLTILKDHNHYVQGVCWDPLGQFVATNSSDRSCRLYSTSPNFRCSYNINKLQINGNSKTLGNGEQILKQNKMFHDETMPSFFRRLNFTPDGSLLLVPSGRVDVGDHMVNTTYVFTRASPNKPVVYLPSPNKATMAVSCCPIYFELNQPKDEDMENKEKSLPLFKLPYRMVFAVATLDSVLLYDTQQKCPFGFVGNIHYAAISDLTWSHDGQMLVASSTDGYCSILHFEEGELGKPINTSLKEAMERNQESGKAVPLTPQNATEVGVKTPRRISLTPVTDNSVSADKTNTGTGSAVKKEKGKIDKFTVPVTQIPPNVTPTRPPPGVTPRRVTLVPVSSDSPTNCSVTSCDAVAEKSEEKARRVELTSLPLDSSSAGVCSNAQANSKIQPTSSPSTKVEGNSGVKVHLPGSSLDGRLHVLASSRGSASSSALVTSTSAACTGDANSSGAAKPEKSAKRVAFVTLSTETKASSPESQVHTNIPAPSESLKHRNNNKSSGVTSDNITPKPRRVALVTVSTETKASSPESQVYTNIPAPSESWNHHHNNNNNNKSGGVTSDNITPKPRRVTLVTLSTETKASSPESQVHSNTPAPSESLNHRNNNNSSGVTSDNITPKPRRVALVTLTDNTGNTRKVEGCPSKLGENEGRPCEETKSLSMPSNQVQTPARGSGVTVTTLTPREDGRRIPLEPVVIVVNE